MSDEKEIHTDHPEISLPNSPATRLTDKHHARLRGISRLPLGSCILTAVLLPIGIFQPAWVPILNLLVLGFAALTVLSTAILLIFVVQARKAQQKMLSEVLHQMLPLIQTKYEVDVTYDLLHSLASGATLPLMVKRDITRVALKNTPKGAVLIHAPERRASTVNENAE
jgi:hypothetical protein